MRRFLSGVPLLAVGMFLFSAVPVPAQDRQEGRSAKEQEVTGTVVRSKDVMVRGTGATDRVVLLETEEGESLVVDLGEKSQLQDVSVGKGDTLTVRGTMVKVGDRRVLRAGSVRVGDRTVDVQRAAQPAETRQVSGTVLTKKEVDVRGQSGVTGKNLVVLLRTESGDRVYADLGSLQQLGTVEIAAGQQLSVRGRTTRVGEYPVVMATRVDVGGKTVTISRPEPSGKDRLPASSDRK